MFRGSLVALITPMHSDGRVDFTRLEQLVDYHCAQGTDGIVSMGTTGESATLDEAEHCEVIRRTVELVDGRIPVIAGTGANCTREAIRLTRCAQDSGANAALLVTPYYNKPTQEGLYRHYMSIAEAVDLPLILYNVPGRTACDLHDATSIRLAECEQIIGLKDATGDLQRARNIIEACGDKLYVYAGDDATSRELMLLGGKGVISVTSNVAPSAMHAMCEAALEGDAAQALELDTPLQGLHRDLFLESNPIPVKYACWKMGLIEDGIRLPLTWLAEEWQQSLVASMRQAGCLD